MLLLSCFFYFFLFVILVINKKLPSGKGDNEYESKRKRKKNYVCYYAFDYSIFVYHELGHFLAWIAGNVDKRSEFATIYKSEKEKYTGVRKAYVTQNASEYFAESYRDYILSGSNLKKSRPKTYAYVRNAVQTIQNSPDRITKIKNVYKVI